jgi:hypothetical protein
MVSHSPLERRRNFDHWLRDQPPRRAEAPTNTSILRERSSSHISVPGGPTTLAFKQCTVRPGPSGTGGLAFWNRSLDQNGSFSDLFPLAILEVSS